MGKVFVVAFLALCAYVGWQQHRPAKPLAALYDRPYVVVYGRDACGYTQQMKRALDKSGIPYQYEIIDQADVRDLILTRMRDARIDTSSYRLPVVDVSAKIYMEAEPAAIVAAYRGG